MRWVEGIKSVQRPGLEMRCVGNPIRYSSKKSDGLVEAPMMSTAEAALEAAPNQRRHGHNGYALAPKLRRGLPCLGGA